jgi:hypothetical protein
MTAAAKLDALIEDLIVDAYDDEEQLPAFLVGAPDLTLAPESARGLVAAAYRRWQGR